MQKLLLFVVAEAAPQDERSTAMARSINIMWRESVQIIPLIFNNRLQQYFVIQTASLSGWPYNILEKNNNVYSFSDNYSVCSTVRVVDGVGALAC